MESISRAQYGMCSQPYHEHAIDERYLQRAETHHLHDHDVAVSCAKFLNMNNPSTTSARENELALQSCPMRTVCEDNRSASACIAIPAKQFSCKRSS